MHEVSHRKMEVLLQLGNRYLENNIDETRGLYKVVDEVFGIDVDINFVTITAT